MQFPQATESQLAGIDALDLVVVGRQGFKFLQFVDATGQVMEPIVGDIQFTEQLKTTQFHGQIAQEITRKVEDRQLGVLRDVGGYVGYLVLGQV